MPFWTGVYTRTLAPGCLWPLRATRSGHLGWLKPDIKIVFWYYFYISVMHDTQNPARLWTLTLAAIGVVYGDIGTGPLYVFKEVLHAGHDIERQPLVMGTVSLIFWALVMIVSIKYLWLVLRSDHEGEGGNLAMMALAQRAYRRPKAWIQWVGLGGMALFLVDGMMTPAISVLSAIEGFELAPGIGPHMGPYVLPLSTLILIGLFAIQAKGTERIARFFAPVIVTWFLTIAVLGVLHIRQHPVILQALHPVYGWQLLSGNARHALAVLGTLFLAVTGAEALYADIGHFGKTPIRLGWGVLAFPCLMLNYMGQGAMALNLEQVTHPFFQMIPADWFWPVLVLSALAAVIASQAVITGAFSLAHQATQLGYLPRLTVRQTSAQASGQIYVPIVNAGLLVGVLLLIVMFRHSSGLASAYGITITLSMLLTNLLLWVIARHVWGWHPLLAWGMVIPAMVIDGLFVLAVLDDVLSGGWFTIAMGLLIMGLLLTWHKGKAVLSETTDERAIPLSDLVEIVRDFPPNILPDTAIFLTRFSDRAPFALVNNIKSHRVLHERTVLLETWVTQAPRVDESRRLSVSEFAPGFWRVQVKFGFMEQLDVPHALRLLPEHGLAIDLAQVSYYVGRRSSVSSENTRLPAWQHGLFAFMQRNAAHPSDYYHLPPDRVVEVIVRYRL